MTNTNDRIDRIETLLERFIDASLADTRASDERLTRIEQLVASNSHASDERLTQIEQLIASNSRASDERLTRIEQLVASNSRSIQALSDDLAEFKLTVMEEREQTAEERAELRRATIGIANLLSSLDQDRPTILRRLSSIENKVNRLLERETGDESQS